MSIALKATVTVDFGTGRSRTDITTVDAFVHEAIHALIQVHGTAEAKRLVLERFERYDQNYPGLAAVRRAARQGGTSAVADVHAEV